jgi:predicted rRNA methylase YqxC with S4 and FtsJ domains
LRGARARPGLHAPASGHGGANRARGDARGTRLDVALIRRHPELSRRKARDVILKGQVSVDGQTALEAGREVAEGAEIRWNPNKKALSRARLSLPLLYGDDSLLVSTSRPV